MTRDDADRRVNILMYHSIARGPGPLAIAADAFRMQMETLAQCGFRGIALRDFVARHRAVPAAAQGGDAPDRVVVLTFDDGYFDFVEVALPEIESRGWGCTVFLSSGLVGTAGGWDPDGAGRRRLLDWTDAERIARRGVELGAHGVTHADLTTLIATQAGIEIVSSKETIERLARCVVTSFAAPYGHSTPELRAQIARSYECAVGTSMAAATYESDPHDLPRIDMWYFRDPGRWRRYLLGATAYFTVRRVLRRARLAIGPPHLKDRP